MTNQSLSTTQLKLYVCNIQAELGSLDHFIVSAPSSATAGSYFSLSVTAVDAYGNTITTYSSSVGLSASSGSDYVQQARELLTG